MPSPRTYTTAGAFRRALEERLKRASMTDQVDLNRLRRQVSFDRLLARLFREESAPWALKGGYALELRFKTARATVDIDLTLQRVVAGTVAVGDTNRIVREMLQRAAGISLGDCFEFVIGPPVMDLMAAPYGGARYPVEARMDERIFARFHLDAGIGDVVMQPLETIVCRDWLGFAGIESSQVRMIAREQQFAEKIHLHAPAERCEQQSEGFGGPGSSGRLREEPVDGVLFRAPSGAERPFGERSDVGVEGSTPTTPVALSGAIHADGSEAGGFSWISRSGRKVSRSASA
jgi:hypothetical protein